jgi:hypothetical protein
MTTSLEFFATPGLLTDPGRRSALLAALPHDVPALCRIVQGLMIHIFWADQYGVQLAEPRRDEVQLRFVASKLDRILELDPRPLTEAREPDQRLVGNCRDFTVLLTTFLRRQGVPARARCGFARYFLPNHFEDHWVCEYWNAAEQRWVLTDAQLDPYQVGQLAVRFDPLDVPRDEFIVGGQAWQMCRAGQADPETFGIADLHGLWFVRGDFVRDIAALNKIELLPWDSWGLIEAPDGGPSPDDLAALDEMAALSIGAVPGFDRVRRLYAAGDRWRVPATILSYSAQGAKPIEWATRP